jgi:glyoxylase-like metal-dependent hydrolase (beta-lactamase superfamily II)
MKKGLKIGIIAAAIVVAVLFSMMFLYAMKFKKETNAMTPLQTQKFREGVYVLQDDYVNVYILDTDNQYVAIDAGAHAKAVAAEMTKLGLDPDNVGHVLLTHSDRDHVNGIKTFSQAKVYLPRDEEQMINGSTKRMGMVRNSLKADYELLQPNEIKRIGDIEIRCIPTPGHTPGSMSFLVNGKFLFAGDNMSIRNGKVQLFNETFNMDSETQSTSLNMLAQLEDVQYIFTAHYGMTSDFQNTIADWK